MGEQPVALASSGSAVTSLLSRETGSPVNSLAVSAHHRPCSGRSLFLTLRGCGLAGKCRVTGLEISDHVRENSRVARRPGRNREFSR